MAKLSFLRTQDVSSPVTGLRRSALDKEEDPALAAMAASFVPQTQGSPRLVQIAPACELALNDLWLDMLIKVREVGWGVPPEYVRVIDVPGQRRCGLIVAGSSSPEYPESSDDFFDGPIREGSTRCGDLPNDDDILVEDAGRIRGIAIADSRSHDGGNLSLEVRDTRTGKRYWLNEGMRGAKCSPSWQLPDAFEWQTTAKGLALHPSGDGALIDRLLREQCQDAPEQENLTCRGLDSADADESAIDDKDIFPALRKGKAVPIHQLVDILGAERLRAYRAAIASRDHASYRALLAKGVPPRWTGAEIRALGRADLPLEEKRRRIALLFANATQLERALNDDRYDLPEGLLGWLTTQDWGPILRAIGRTPDLWSHAAASLRQKAVEAERSDLACAIDHAQGFLCGGGIVPE